MSALRIGIVGAGTMGSDHALTLHRFVSGARVVAAADVDRSRALALADAIPGLAAGTDPLALVADPDVDAVVVASHDATHEELTLACLAAGKPVLCEKPLAPTVDGAARIVAADLDVAARTGRHLVAVGFMRRFDPGYVALREALRRNEIGRPLVVHCTHRGVRSYDGTTSASSLRNSAVHEFDVLPWLLGSPVEEVTWFAGRPAPAGEAGGFADPQVVVLRMRDGVLVTLETFLNAGYGYDVRCAVVGERGTLALTNPVDLVGDGDGRRATPYPPDWRGRFAQAFRLELQAWVDAVRAGRRPPLATAQEALTATVVAQAAVTSMRDGGPVAVPPPPTATAG